MRRRKPKFSIKDSYFKVTRKIWEIYTQEWHIKFFKKQILTFTSSYIPEKNRNIKQNPPIKRSKCHKCNLRNDTVLDLPLHRLQKPIKPYNIRGLRFSTRSQKILIDTIAKSNIFLKVYYCKIHVTAYFNRQLEAKSCNTPLFQGFSLRATSCTSLLSSSRFYIYCLNINTRCMT